MLNNSAKYSRMIKAEALRLGFMACGISKADFLAEEAPRLEEWLNKNFQSGTSYANMRVDEMKTKAWILLNNLKVSYISEWKDLWIIDELKTSQSIANTLISNETNINSNIEVIGVMKMPDVLNTRLSEEDESIIAKEVTQ